MRKSILLGAAALAAGLAAAPASAELVLIAAADLTGQGIGATTTAFDPSVARAIDYGKRRRFFSMARPFGNAKTGASQSTTFTLADLGITSASQLGLIVNLSEPGSESPPSVTTANSTLATYGNRSNTITLHVFQFKRDSARTAKHRPQALLQQSPGVGGSGLIFGLTPAEQIQLNNTTANKAGTEVFTVGATFANARWSGSDTSG
jgi:hypothetical protein